MCYPQPGPHCSSHTRKALQNKYKEYLRAKASNDEDMITQAHYEYQQARWNFLMTPQGARYLDALRQEAIAAQDHQQIHKIIALKKKVQQAREDQISDLLHLDRFSHLSFEQLQRTIDQEDEALDRHNQQTHSGPYVRDETSFHKGVKITSRITSQCRIKRCTKVRYASSDVCIDHWNAILQQALHDTEGFISPEVYSVSLRTRNPELTEDDIENLMIKEMNVFINARVENFSRVRKDDVFKPKAVK